MTLLLPVPPTSSTKQRRRTDLSSTAPTLFSLPSIEPYNQHGFFSWTSTGGVHTTCFVSSVPSSSGLSLTQPMWLSHFPHIGHPTHVCTPPTSRAPALKRPSKAHSDSTLVSTISLTSQSTTNNVHSLALIPSSGNLAGRAPSYPAPSPTALHPSPGLNSAHSRSPCSSEPLPTSSSTTSYDSASFSLCKPSGYQWAGRSHPPTAVHTHCRKSTHISFCALNAETSTHTDAPTAHSSSKTIWPHALPSNSSTSFLSFLATNSNSPGSQSTPKHTTMPPSATSK
jgi:hypothetical protein